MVQFDYERIFSGSIWASRRTSRLSRICAFIRYKFIWLKLIINFVELLVIISLMKLVFTSSHKENRGKEEEILF